jgi:folate-dependent phosphoribosylglycinamide formyltransferase PurN
MKYALFAYDFPHKKTKDFILTLEYFGYKLACIVAAPYVKLNIPQPKIRTSVHESELLHPRDLAKLFGIPYFVMPHNSAECIGILKKSKIDIGIIGGARILSQDVINAVQYGIINFHPGLIPENRGLDNLKWAIYMGIPQGVTSHFIDKRVDAGRVIIRKIVQIYSDDTLFDIQQRLYETQLELIDPTLKLVQIRSLEDFKLITGGESRTVMPEHLERKIPEMFETYLKKFGLNKEEE